jgi:hypothetical protein
MLGVSPATYTFLHALISLIAIGSGLIIMFGFLIRRKLNALIFNLSDHHGVDERDRLWFSIRSMFAVTHHRHPLVAGVGTRDSGALRFSSRRPMALGRCRRGLYSALPQRIRSDRADLLEGAGVQSTCSDTERAAVPDRPA